jgi:peptidoglycan/LPS O-acetylase OafA/YrhL
MAPSIGPTVAAEPRRASIAARTETRRNAFDVLRLLAASLVLILHCYALTDSGAPALWPLLGVGVVMFFAMSGFLVTRSWLAQPAPGAFAAKRALRLFPALVVVVALTALVLGPAVTTVSLGTYFGDPATYLYVVKCSLLWTVQNHLPGVFAGNPYPDAANGSLWTLPVEAGAYVGVAVVGLTIGLRRGWLPLAAVVVGTFLLTPVVALDKHLALSTAGTEGIQPTVVIQLYVAFAAGMLMWIERERVALRWRYLVPALVLWVLVWKTSWGPAVAALVVPYATLFAAFRLPQWANGLNRRLGDPSYGVYILAFPVQQTLVQLLGRGISPGVLLLVSWPVTLVLAVASWRLVERPALAHKPGRRRRSDTPVPGPTADPRAEPDAVSA